MTSWPLPLCIAVALAFLWSSHQPSTGGVWILGCAIGWLLVRGRFGFSAPLRRVITHGEAHALAPQAALLTLLILGSGLLQLLVKPLGISLRPTGAPISWSFAAGAFLFGIGMQMARRCASGALASAARANGDFFIPLVGLMAGVFAASLHRPALEKLLPGGWPPILLLQTLPLGLAVLVQLGLLVICFESLLALAQLRLKVSAPNKPSPTQASASSPSAATVVGLAILLLLLFGVSGEPWKVLWGLGLSGAHLAQLAGWNPESSAFWGTQSRLALLAEPWAQQGAVVVNLGVIYGAFVAGHGSGSATAPQSPFETHPAVVLRQGMGGLLMGYGGFLSYGCNISSFIGGVMSFSLHGWLWLLAAFAGSTIWLHWEQRQTRVSAKLEQCSKINDLP